MSDGRRFQKTRRGAMVLPALLLAAAVAPLPAAGAGPATRAAAPATPVASPAGPARESREGAQPLTNGSTSAAALAAQASPPAAGPYENLPIPRGGRRESADPQSGSDAANAPAGESAGGAGSAPAAAPATAPAGTQNYLDLPKVSLALAIVLVIVFVLQKAGRKMFAGSAAGSSNRAIRVISRTNVSPRQQLLLIHVGRRLVLTANSGTQMNALCEISDPDEVAALVGQLPEAKSDGVGGAFKSIFSATGRRFDAGLGEGQEDESGDGEANRAVPRKPWIAAGADDDGADAGPPATREAVSRETAAPDEAAAIHATSAELGGLTEKVRRIAQQFQRS